MNQAERVLLLEKMIDKIGYRKIGLKRAITCIEMACNTIAKGGKVPSEILVAPYVEDLKNAGVIAEDIEKVKANRETVAQLLRDKTILLLERGFPDTYTIGGNLAKPRVSQYITAKDIEDLHAIHIMEIDWQYNFSDENASLIQTLLAKTNLTPTQIANKVSKLSRGEMKNLNKQLDKHILVIQRDVVTLRKAYISHLDALADVKRIANGEASIYSNIRDPQTIKDANLNPQIIESISTPAFKDSLPLVQVEINDGLLFSIFKDFDAAISVQTIAVAMAMVETLTAWVNCFIENVCPLVIPKGKEILTVAAAAKDRIETILISIISSMMLETGVSMDTAFEDIFRVADHQRPKQNHYYTDIIRDEQWQPEMLKERLTDAFKTEVKTIMELDKIKKEVSHQNGRFMSYSRNFIRPHAETNVMIDRFARWNDCNFHNQCPADEAGLKELWTSPAPPQNATVPNAIAASSNQSQAILFASGDKIVAVTNHMPELIIAAFLLLALAAKPVAMLYHGWSHRLFGSNNKKTDDEDDVTQVLIEVKTPSSP